MIKLKKNKKIRSSKDTHAPSPRNEPGDGCFESELNEKNSIITIKEYRKILCDYKSTSRQVLLKLSYLEGLCRNIISAEMEEYVKGGK